LGNIILALTVPHLGWMREPVYSVVNVFWACLEVAVPSLVLMVLLPVFLFGRDTPRLLALGLSFLPAYVAVTGLAQAASLWRICSE